MGLSLQEILPLLRTTRTKSEKCCEIGLIFLSLYENRMSDYLQISEQGSSTYSSIIFSCKPRVDLIKRVQV